MYKIAIERTFSASHALKLPDGSMEPVHSHEWRVRVSVFRDQLDAMDLVMDFHELEQIVDRIIRPLYGTDLNRVAPIGGNGLNPTAEHVARWIADQVALDLPEPVSLRSVMVGEAPGCTVVYRP